LREGTRDRPFPGKRSDRQTAVHGGRVLISKRRFPRRLIQNPKHEIIGEISSNPTTIGVSFAPTSNRQRKELKGLRGCVDTGAPKSVCGRETAVKFCKRIHIPFDLSPSETVFKFADQTANSLGRLLVPLRTPVGIRSLQVDVVDADIPLLLGLDFMDNMNVTANTLTNRLESREGWSLPLTRHGGHVYLEWEQLHATMFSSEQLRKLHRQFFHPSADKLYNLLKRARPEDASEETRALLQEITESCHFCQMMARKPITFSVGSAKDPDITFNREVALDIMYLNGRPALHIVDMDTHFHAASFLRSVSTDDVWDAIIRNWANTYAGFPESMLTDQGSQLMSARFKEFALHFGIDMRHTPIESHNSNGLVERYHGPLRRTYEKVRLDYGGISDELALSCAVLAANQTLGPEGIVPVTLVLGIIPRISTRLPNQPERVQAMIGAREEMRKLMAKAKVARALKRAVPPAADQFYAVGDRVLVFREEPEGFTGPFRIEHVDHKTIYIRDGNQTKAFSRAQVKPYREITHHREAATEVVAKIGSAVAQDFQTTYVTEVLSPNDQRSNDPKMNQAKKREIKGLLERGTFRIILKSEIPQGANVLGGRYVLVIKDAGTEREVWKARYVIQGHRDQEKEIMVRSSTNVQQRSIRLIFALASILGFKIWTQDVTQAYLQSAGTLAREVFIDKPAPELELSPHQALKLLRPLYGLADSGDFWHRELSKHHRNMGMRPLTTDNSAWIKLTKNVLEGISGVYVDDVVQAGTTAFDILTDRLSSTYDAKSKEYGDGRIAGIEFKCDDDGISVSQSQYLSSLKPLPTDASYEDFRSSRMKLMWMIHTRPDVAYCAATASQVTLDQWTTSSGAAIRRLNATIKRLRSSPEEAMRFPKLDRRTLRICVFSDASFANNEDMSSQMGYIVFLIDGENRCATMSFKSVKCKRVTRSVLAAEAIAFAEGFDQGYALKLDLQEALGMHVPLTILTDSKTLFDVITKASYTQEKRILIDLASAREGYRKLEIDDIGLVSSEENLADGFTKETNMDRLRQAVRTGKLNTIVKQFVIRSPEDLQISQ
jgi:Reverse transcriptase (RNA-dependent DNA polymerase)